MFSNNVLEIIINFIIAVIISIILIKIHLLIWLVTLLNGMITLIINFITMLWKKPLIKKNLITKLDFHQQVILSQKTFEDAYFRNLQDHLQMLLHNKYHNYLKNDYQLNNLAINNNSFISIIKNIINFITIYLSLVLIFKNKINLSQLIFISSINTYIITFFQNIGTIFITFPSFSKSWQRFNIFLNLKVNESSKINNKPTKIININEISLFNCSLKIDNKILLKNLTLSFKNSNFIVGKTGVGKTTLLLLIALKFNDFTGKILVNQQEINPFRQKDWQDKCIYLAPNPIIYQGTVLENIFSFAVTNEKILLLQKLQIDNILNNLNLSTFYYCQNEGINLSQGQKQIIAFLSLFFYDWKVILLDETLSNVNVNLKIFLINMLLEYFHNKIIIYAGHDLVLTKMFQNIIDLNVIIKGS